MNGQFVDLFKAVAHRSTMVALGASATLWAPTARAQVSYAASLPAGTSVSVRTVEAIESKGAEPGQSYRCTVESPIVAEGKQLVARGADCVLRIVETKEADRLSGNAELKLELTAVRVDRDLIDVSSEPAAVQGAGKGKGTAIKTGVGAAAGAALGGIFGGGKGAAIGASAGAGAGVAVAAVTRGLQVRVAPETVLSFVTH